MDSFERLARLKAHIALHGTERHAHYIQEVLAHCEYLLTLEHNKMLYILPCKIGEGLYLIRYACNSKIPRLGKATTVSHRNLGYVIENYGKTLFLKHDAERIIEEIKNKGQCEDMRVGGKITNVHIYAAEPETKEQPHWIRTEEFEGGEMTCSNCESTFLDCAFSYCPGCGSYMLGGK